ncbi:MAG TPA: hypothetical protein VG297_10125 [Bryobacteraceae bacterium]|nr:hypothetical protein [Bryobacteraceae bacterium]
MSQSPEFNPPLGQAEEASRQIESVERISLIAHSGGTIAAALFAIHNPEWSTDWFSLLP